MNCLRSFIKTIIKLKIEQLNSIFAVCTNMEKFREKSWNFHTCKLCPYRSKSTFLMYKHGRLYRRKLKNGEKVFFTCHLKTLEMFECQFCGFDTNVKVDLNEHLSVIHEGKEDNEEMENILKRYRCRKCDFETHSLVVLAKHVDGCRFDDSLQQKGMFSIIKMKNTDDLRVINTEKLEGSRDMFQTFEVMGSNDDGQLLKEITNKKAIIVLMHIDPAKSSSSRKKKYYSPKQSCCFYCKKLRFKIARHYEKMHSNKVEVREFIHLPKGCSKRKKMIEKLRLLGNFEYNISKDCQQMITCRRLQMKNCKKHYLPCGNCKGYYAKTSLRQHFRRCTNKRSQHKNSFLLGKRLKYNFVEKACQKLKVDILPVLRSEEIVETIVNDPLLTLYGNNLCSKHASSPGRDMYIRTILRRLVKFYIEVKEMYPQIRLFQEILDPLYFEGICNAFNKLGKKDPKTGVYRTPSTALNLGIWFREYAKFYITGCIQNKNFKERGKAEELLGLMREMFANLSKTRRKKEILCRLHT